jgi:hypothetical protein
MSDNLPNWPHGYRNHMDGVTREQGIVSDYPRLRRTPNRAELFHPYIPADILEDRLQPMDPHIQAAIDRLVRDAENDAIAMANDENGREGYESEDESEEMDIDPEDEEMSVITIPDDEHEHVNSDAPDIFSEPSANVHNAGRAVSHDANAVDDKNHVNYCVGLHRSYANVPLSGHNDPSHKTHADIKEETSDMSLWSQQPEDARELTQTYHEALVSSTSNIPSTWPTVPSVSQPKPDGNANLENRNNGQRNLIEIVTPENQCTRRTLIDAFRREVLHDWIQDALAENGIHNPHISAFEIHSIEVDEAINNLGFVHGRPYLLVGHFIRHDWHPRSGDCIYTLQTPAGRERGSAEGLETRFSGVRYAVWSYWGERGHVRRDNVVRHLEMMGRHGFYQILMWPWMEEEVWLSMWRNRRASRRA